MKLDFKIQSKELNLADMFDIEMSRKPKNVYMFLGILKDDGFEILEESLIDTKSKITMFLGIDKRHTTKKLLEDVLTYAKDVYVYNNNHVECEFKSNIYVFEFDKTAVMYTTAASVSENGVKTDKSIITKVTFELTKEEDKISYKNNIKVLLDLKNDHFTKLTKSLISDFIKDKVIFSSRQYERTVKSISEFLGKSEEKSEKQENSIYSDEIFTHHINIDDTSLDIDISDVEDAVIMHEEIKEEKPKKTTKKETIEKEKVEVVAKLEEEEEDFEFDNLEVIDGVVDLSSMLFTESNIKLGKAKKEKIEDEFTEEKFVSKKVDLNNVSNFIFELPTKNKDSEVIRIPNYIRTLIPNFFEFQDAKSEDINGATYKVRNIQIEAVDALNNTKTLDNNAKIMQKKGQTYTVFASKELESINYEEKDIARIIKLSRDVYHIEIISKEMQEYKIWYKTMNMKLKGVDRKYGIM